MPVASEGVPEAGDILWVNFDPPIGREQAGRRPAVVVSSRSYNEISTYIVVCPVTRSVKPWPFKVTLPSETAIEGAVLVDQVRALDRTERVLKSHGRVSSEILADIRSVLASMLGIPVAT
jgi:mRNA interferase MazF